MLFVEVVSVTGTGPVEWALIHSGPRILRRIANRKAQLGVPVRHVARTKGSAVLCHSDSSDDPCNFVHASPEADAGKLRRQVTRAFGDVALSGMATA